MTSGALVPTGIVSWCCGLHREVKCCDPEDCGPCCPECPSCPFTTGMSPYLRKILRGAMDRENAYLYRRLIFGDLIAEPAPIHRPQVPTLAPVQLSALWLGVRLPWVTVATP